MIRFAYEFITGFVVIFLLPYMAVLAAVALGVGQ